MLKGAEATRAHQHNAYWVQCASGHTVGLVWYCTGRLKGAEATRAQEHKAYWVQCGSGYTVGLVWNCTGRLKGNYTYGMYSMNSIHWCITHTVG